MSPLVIDANIWPAAWDTLWVLPLAPKWAVYHLYQDCGQARKGVTDALLPVAGGPLFYADGTPTRYICAYCRSRWDHERLAAVG